MKLSYTIFKVHIRTIHKDVLFDDMNKALEFYLYQKDNDVDVRYFLRKKLWSELETKIKEDTLQESDDILIETLERVCAVMSCDFGNYTEEFDREFWNPYFNKFQNK